MKQILVTLVMFLTCLPLISVAHEGHGVVEHGPAHYLLSIEHAWPLVIIAIGIAYIVGRRIFRKTS